jgi:hypothetical protein
MAGGYIEQGAFDDHGFFTPYGPRSYFEGTIHIVPYPGAPDAVKVSTVEGGLEIIEKGVVWSISGMSKRVGNEISVRPA